MKINTEHKTIALNIKNHGELFGSYDSNIRLLEETYGVNIICRDESIRIAGDEPGLSRAERAVNAMITRLDGGGVLDDQAMRYIISLVSEDSEGEITDLGSECILITCSGKPIRPKTLGQKKYVKAILENSITIASGPAGTGKTYLAVCMAVAAFRQKKVGRIILTRPAVEAGEKLGFLPGDLQQKIDPYLRPLYDALFDTLGSEGFHKYHENGSIEVAPLAYMRGRTLDDSFIILDEAQNTTREQMKMFLTRMGYNSKIVVTGDDTQIDLPDRRSSGLLDAIRVVSGIKGIAAIKLTSKDVVRHHLVTEIINAYEKRDKTRIRAKNHRE